MIITNDNPDILIQNMFDKNVYLNIGRTVNRLSKDKVGYEYFNKNRIGFNSN